MHVLLLVGSTRPDSLNSQLAEVAARALPPGSTVERVEGLADLPFYTEQADLEPPAAATQLREAIGRADAVVVSTPEFNASIPAVLKNAIDWASRPREASTLAGKPVAVLGATPSPGGTLSAREHLIAILARARALPLPTSVGIGSAHQAFDGGELADPEQAAAVTALIRELTGDLVAA